jgi:hypothetical protein
MKIINYKPNQTIVKTGEYTALLSYGVPQIVVMHARENLVLVNSRKYSVTTSKHRNAYLKEVLGNPGIDNTVQASPAEIQEATGLETRFRF